MLGKHVVTQGVTVAAIVLAEMMYLLKQRLHKPIIITVLTAAAHAAHAVLCQVGVLKVGHILYTEIRPISGGCPLSVLGLHIGSLSLQHSLIKLLQAQHAVLNSLSELAQTARHHPLVCVTGQYPVTLRETSADAVNGIPDVLLGRGGVGCYSVPGFSVMSCSFLFRFVFPSLITTSIHFDAGVVIFRLSKSITGRLFSSLSFIY